VREASKNFVAAAIKERLVIHVSVAADLPLPENDQRLFHYCSKRLKDRAFGEKWGYETISRKQ
jgi:hypothetical protein